MAVRRIAIGPGEVAGYFSRLKSGFDAIGVPCEHYVLAADEFSYNHSRYFLQKPFALVMRLVKSPRLILQKLGKLAAALLRAAALLHAIVRCDVFIMPGFGSYLGGYHELGLLRLLGKRVIVVYLGSDARPPFFSGRHLDDRNDPPTPIQIAAEARKMVRRIRRAERHAFARVNHTATAQFFQKPFLRLFALGLPVCPPESHLKYLAPGASSGALRLLHAPSRPNAKGSQEIRRIVRELQAEGEAVELIELRGLPNSQVLESLRDCDAVVDELYSDSPMATLAAEAAMFGKPAVVGGYYSDAFPTDNADSTVPPSMFVRPEEVKSSIRRLAREPGFRHHLGCRARDFVETHWSVEHTARRFLRVVEEGPPREWMCFPSSLTYVLGWGLSTHAWQAQVERFVGEVGEAGLLLESELVVRMRQQLASVDSP